MSDVIRAFNIVANSYDEWYKHPQGKQVFNAELKAVETMVPVRGIGLELGAGTGIFAEHLSNEERMVVCLDPSEEMLSKARLRDLISVLGVGGYLPFRVGVLVFTYMITVLEFLDDPVGVFEEVKRTTRHGAPLVILFINSESVWGDFYREIGSKGDPVFQHARLYTLKQVIELLGKSGYTVYAQGGTLTTGPMRQAVGGELVETPDTAGVIIIQAEPS